jgi:hypothetical protein
MVGHMSSLTTLVEHLKKESVENYAITELVQGQTRRWVLGWSFDEVRLPDVRISANKETTSGIMLTTWYLCAEHCESFKYRSPSPTSSPQFHRSTHAHASHHDIATKIKSSAQ